MSSSSGSDRLIWHRHTPFLCLAGPESRANLHMVLEDSQFDWDGSRTPLVLKPLELNGIELQDYGPDRKLYRGKGTAVFDISVDFHRGALERAKIAPSKDYPGLEGFLALDKDSGIVKADLEPVISSILDSCQGSQHPYDLVAGAALWMESNIRPVPFPAPLRSQLLAIISGTYPSRRDPYEIARKFISTLHVDGEAQSRLDTIKSHLGQKMYSAGLDGLDMYEDDDALADRMSRRLGGSTSPVWFLGRYTSAGSTLSNSSGQCQGLSDLFISIVRSQGIPAKAVDGLQFGYEGGEGIHRWAADWLEPYGWVEYDPSIPGRLDEFEADCHAYPLGNYSGDEPRFTLSRAKP